MTLNQALQNSPAPPEVLASQSLVEVEYLDFEGKTQKGYLVAHRELEAEIRAIFADILRACFPIFQMQPLHELEWSDDVSMARNNTSAFNYRRKVGKTALSFHATGRAIDINPVQNPYIKGDLVLPPGACYDPQRMGAILGDGPVVAAFESRGWVWGGRWLKIHDYHHFQKPEAKGRP